RSSRSLTRKARCPTLGSVAWICQLRNVPSLELFVHRLRPASSLDGAGGWAAGSAPSCVDALHLQRLDEADQVALGILELPELDHVHDRLRTHDAGAAEALRHRERLLDVRHRDVEGDVALVPVRPAGAAEQELEQHRAELTAYCYRMLGSPFEAEDAVQETLLRAWRGLDRFEGRAALRSWLYRIATNVCFDMLNARERRARPMDLGPAREPVESNLNALPEVTWIEPVPATALAAESDPAEVAVAHETIRLAVVAAPQHPPPRRSRCRRTTSG